jgi:transketolase
VRNKFAEVVHKEGKKNKKITVLVADISPAGAITEFRKEFPDRFINTGVSEQSMIGIAAGLALRGMRPFCYTIATFSLYRPFEMIRVDLCYQNLPVTVIGMGAGLVYSTLGGTHHTIEDIAVASALPNMTVLCPCDPAEMKLATEWCATKSKGPVYMRLGKRGEKNFTLNAKEKFKIGKIRKVTEGKDIALITYGTLISIADEVQKKLQKNKILASIYSCHTIKPLDEMGITKILKKYKQIVIMEEHVPNGGLTDKILSLAYKVKSKSSIKSFTLKDKFIKFYGTHVELLNAHGISADKIIRSILKKK